MLHSNRTEGTFLRFLAARAKLYLHNAHDQRKNILFFNRNKYSHLINYMCVILKCKDMVVQTFYQNQFQRKIKIMIGIRKKLY